MPKPDTGISGILEQLASWLKPQIRRHRRGGRRIYTEQGKPRTPGGLSDIEHVRASADDDGLMPPLCVASAPNLAGESALAVQAQEIDGIDRKESIVTAQRRHHGKGRNQDHRCVKGA